MRKLCFISAIIVLLVSMAACNYTGAEKATTPSAIQYSELIGLPYGLDEIDQHGDFYTKLSLTIHSYMITNAYYNLSYPNQNKESHPPLLLYIALGLERGELSANFNINDYKDSDTGEYTIPKEIFNDVMAAYLNKPVLDENFLVEQGFLLPDKSAYKILLEGFGLGGYMYISNIQSLDDYLVEVSYDCYGSEEKANPTMQINIVLDTSTNQFKIKNVSSFAY